MAVDKLKEYEEKISATPYEGAYTEQINKMVASYLGKDKFNYNPNNDSTYQQMRDTYTKAGKTAMQDTLGSGALLSGGNNNSAALVAAQQVNNNYAKGISEAIPTLESSAYSRYNNEVSDMLNGINLIGTIDDKEYTRHQNEISKIMNLLSYYDTKQQTGRTEVLNLLLSGVDVDDETLKNAGISQSLKKSILNRVSQLDYM